MKKNITYYLIRDSRLGKREGNKYYLFRNGKWIEDDKNYIQDHLLGFDPSEPEDSPYRFGGSTVMDIDEITEEDAKTLIENLSTRGGA